MILKIKRLWLKRLLMVFAGGLLFICLFWFSVYAGLWGKLPTKEQLKNIDQAEASLILDANNELLGKFYIFDRQIVNYNDLPQDLIHALVATEDVRFYEHEGVDYRSFFRVFFRSLLLQDQSGGGGSTISQQLVKNLYGRENHGFLSLPVSKVKEMIVAKRIEDVYTKEEILTLYFNTVPFSDNTFGIESAARKFYNSSASDLTLSQCATLVGTLKASHSFNPRLFPERSQLRRDVVLQQMEKYGFISDNIKKGVNGNELVIDYRQFEHDEGLAPYFREKLRLDIAKILDTVKGADGEKVDIYKDGLKIYTTLDNNLQTYAESSMKQHMSKLQNQFEASYSNNAPWKSESFIIKKLKELPEYQSLKSDGLSEKEIMEVLNEKKEIQLFRWGGDTVQKVSTLDSLKHYMRFLNSGFVAIDPSSGAIKSYVGGVDFEHFKYDHVSMSKRQVGSTFKPIVYTAAIEGGMPPCTYFSVRPVTYVDKDEWTPKNSSKIENEEHLNYSLKKALSNSVNTIAVKVLRETRIDPVIDLAKRMGIQSEIPKVPSIALGTAELSLLELATAYTGYTNKGVSPDPYFVSKIEDRDGNILYEYKAKRVRPSFNETTRQVMLEYMKATIDEGTANRIRSVYKLPNEMAGKTGTTQNNKDGWFVGITPKLVMASWVGHDDHRIGFRTTRMGQGANTALPIVALFLNKVNKDSKYNDVSNAKFTRTSDDVLASLDCDPEFTDGFFRRIFSSNQPKRDFRSERQARKERYRRKRDNGGI